MTKEELSQLAIKVSEGKASMTELALFNATCEAFQKEEINWPGMEKDLLNMEETSLKQIWAEQGNKDRATVKLWPRVAVAAAAVIGIAIGVYFYTSRHLDTPSYRTAGRDLTNDIAPGGNRASLILADGTVVPLSDAKTGVIVNDDLRYNDNTVIPNTDPSSRTNVSDLSSLGAAGMTGVNTPRGGTYSIILQDGTKVWLNADSKLQFFSNYRNKAQRIVKLIGEAYFEVARDTKRPFIVQSAGQDVTVLGTHFNISAYAGEGIRTTLLEGSVRVASLSASGGEPSLRAQRGQNKIDASSYMGEAQRGGGERMAVILKPNQQSLITANSGITVKQVDPTDAIAWKEGDFEFNEEKMSSIMKKIERWYDVDIVVNERIANREFTGKISRSRNISRVLGMIEKTTSVKFKIEGRRVTVIDQ